MDPYTFGLLFGALSIGLICGIVPFKLGKKYVIEELGMAGLIASTIGGLILGIILAFPLAGIFSSIILVSKNN